MIKFSIKPDGAPQFEVEGDTRDVLNWERTSKGKTFGGLMDSLAMGDLYRIAFFASKRQGLFAGTEREFEEQVVLVFKGLTDGQDPTNPAP